MSTNGTGVQTEEDLMLLAQLEASPEYMRRLKAQRQGGSLVNVLPNATPSVDTRGGIQPNNSTGLNVDGQQATPSNITALQVVRPEHTEASRYMPVMSMSVALERRGIIVEAIEKLLVEGINGDYGEIPGTKKKTLLQPGAQKLDNLFGLIAKPVVEEKLLDWTGEDHDGEPFFYFEIRCQLWRGEYLMGEGLGSCNSWESKYRFRTAERSCPVCRRENIRKSKTEKGGWYCWKNTGGCGATFPEGDPSIEKQEVGKKPNADICDVVNTIMKMAFKRAHIAATINATSASEFFSQDVEDQAQSSHALTVAVPENTRGQARRLAKESAERVAERKIEGLREGKSYEQVSAEERTRIETPVATAATAAVAPDVTAPRRPDWTASMPKIRAKFAEISQRMPEGPYLDILNACRVDNSSQFKTPQAAWECYQILEGWIEAAASPGTFENFAVAEGDWQ